MKNCKYLFVLLGLLFTVVDGIFAQGVHHHQIHHNGVLEAIDNARAEGRLSADEAILQQLYAGLRPELLDPEFATDISEQIKFLTTVLLDYYQHSDQLHSETIREVNSLISGVEVNSTTTSSFLSESGRFILHYETEGSNAVPLEDLAGSGVPDYVEKAAAMADSSYRHQVETLGFTDFLKDEPYEISFRNSNAYGFTQQKGSGTVIVINNNFNNFPKNTHPEGDRIGALYVTIAHELKHASQFAVNRWQGNAGDFNWIEMDATMMEEEVFPDVNDYYNYIMTYDRDAERWDPFSPHRNSIFRAPKRATPGAYWHVSWKLYFQEKFGMGFWVDVWENIRQNFQNRGTNEGEIEFFDAVGAALLSRGQTLGQEHVENHVWHIAAGPSFSAPGYGFEDRMNYPEANFEHTLQSVPDSLIGEFILPMAATYVKVLPSAIAIGQPAVTVASNTNGIGVGVIGYFRDGSSEVLVNVNPGSMLQTVQTTWNWSELTDLNLVVVNTNREQGTIFDLSVTSIIPDGDMITQNFPNPFNPTTQIGFSIDNRKHVRIDVFDRIGRKVSTLADRQFDRGFHNVTFDGSGLASGVYFYRIVTNNTAQTKKMVLIK